MLLYEIRIYILVLLALAPAFAVYFFLLRILTHRISFFMVPASALLWFFFHKLYALTPLGNSGIEAPFYGSLALMQLAALGGFGAPSALLVGFSAGLAAFFKTRNRAAAFWVLLFAALLGGSYVWGEGRLKTGERLNFHAALIQHNLPISGKWNSGHPEAIRQKYRALALEASQEKPDLMIFPLYNFPDDPSRNPEFLNALARETGSFILIGTYIPEKPGESISKGFYNTAILYSPEGKKAGEYQAVETPPFRRILEKTGKEYHLLETPFEKLGVLLCYEDASPRMAQRAVHQGAGALIALSNPGHFTSTFLPYYHLMQDRLRAIETGRFVLRVSANGYSAVINPRGKIMTQSALREETILTV